MGVMATREPTITINGQVMTEAQSMTIRKALGTYAIDLATTGLGDDDRGRAVTRLYLERLAEVSSAMQGGADG